MKKLLVIFALLSLGMKAQVPCPNDNSFWLDLTPTGVGNTQSSSCTYAGDYDTFTATAGVTYSFSVCGSSYNSAITMYDNSGTLLYSQNATAGNGCETWTWTATVSGTVRVLVDRANCGTNTTCTSVSITQTSGGGGASGNQNCATPTQVCNDASFTGNSNGLGTQDLNAGNQGCLSVEHQSSWYIFQAVTSGTIALNITTAVDYDFAIWGPNVTCGSLGAPVRCSFAAGGGNTGLGNGAVDLSESAFGDRWVAPLNVTAGQTYIMLIDNFASNSTAFTLDWTMSGGATLNCTPLPIELVSFLGYSDATTNVLEWKTASEKNNKGFELQRSTNAYEWEALHFIEGAGNSQNMLKYIYEDNDYVKGINYYRLKQIDFDNTITYSWIISIDNSKGTNKEVIRVTNLLGQEVDETYKGVRILFYKDGTAKKDTTLLNQ